jgi:hypothetical protein
MGRDIIDEKRAVKMAIYAGTGGMCFMVYEGQNVDNPTVVHSKFWLDDKKKFDDLAASILEYVHSHFEKEEMYPLNYIRLLEGWKWGIK